jgi:hypothetical protein
MAAVRAMVKINPEEPFSPQLKDFIRASNAVCRHPVKKPRTKEKLWFDIEKENGYWKVSNIRGIKNPDQFDIKIIWPYFPLSSAIIIARAILSQKTFRKTGRRFAQGIKFYVNRSFNVYTIERWPRKPGRERCLY